MTATDHRLEMIQKYLASQGASTDEISIEGETRATLVCCVRFTKSCDSGLSRNALDRVSWRDSRKHKIRIFVKRLRCGLPWQQPPSKRFQACSDDEDLFRSTA